MVVVNNIFKDGEQINDNKKKVRKSNDAKGKK